MSTSTFPKKPDRDSAIPKPASGVDVRQLPLTPMEGFVLSRVDGRSTATEIAMVTGLSPGDVAAALQRLEGLGAVQYGDGASRTTSTSPTPRTSPVPGAEPIIREFDGPVPYDLSELDEPAELEADRKREILDTFYRLEKLDHYELLRVPSTADKKAIKTAYFDVVGRYHPDKYFGKNLGAFKTKLERIFQRVTEAHDTLTRANSRSEYDQYLENQRETSAFEDTGEHTLESIRREIEREARYAPPADTNRPSPSSATAPPGASEIPRGSVQPGVSASVSSTPPGAAPRPALSADERRRAFARKLSGSTPAVRSAPPERPSGGPTAREAAAESLKRQYEARLERAREERVRRYVKQAEDAIAAKNLIAAANALRIAVSLAPDDVPLADQLDKVERDGAAAMADKYLEQARYDERRGHMAEAAHAYEKVIRGRPSAHVYERAAHCLLEASGDPKKAFDLAKRAVELSPNETAYRITLARVYAKAGMDASAQGELERARTIDPGDDTVKDWLKRLKRGEI